MLKDSSPFIQPVEGGIREKEEVQAKEGSRRCGNILFTLSTHDYIYSKKRRLDKVPGSIT